MPLSEGTRLGPYEVLAPLGAGGMGEVYRAADTKLGRQIALKILPAAVAQEEGRLARFEREAQVLASLNHPNIAALYGVEESGPALVMELVEGPTLADRIARGPVPLEEALAIARQVCDALEAAHAKGVIHRDLKPANIKITPEGQVKVLDFGLAKALEGDETAAAASATMSPTLTIAATKAGIILGTAAYMSPEQARGVPADQRADIWAFGVVLYEMLTGRTQFEGETVSDTLAAVLRADIDFALLPAGTPARVRRLLRRCLERDRKKRLHHIADARIELDSADELEPAAPQTTAAPRRRQWLTWSLAALLPVAAAAGWWVHRVPPAPVLPGRFLLDPPEGTEFTTSGHSLSPDGRRIIVRARPAGSGRRAGSLYVRELAGIQYRMLPGTEGATTPVWSPDGKSIVFGQQKKIRRLEVAGGAAATILDGAPGVPNSWNEQGTILIGPVSGPILRISAGGGTPAAVTALDAKKGQRWHGYPTFLPGGRHFIFTAGTPTETAAWVGDLQGKEPPRQLLPIDGVEAIYARPPDDGPGVLLFRRDESLMGVRFDPARRAVLSDPFPVLDQIATPGGRNLPVAVSSPARLVLFNEEGGSSSNEELVIFDRNGKRVSAIGKPGEALWGHLEFSPDGTRLSGSRMTPGDRNVHLWNVDIARGTVSRVTFDGGQDKAQAWSSDGRRLFYMLRGSNDGGIFVTPADGSGKPEKLLTTVGHHIGASADGKYVAFEHRQGDARDIHLLALDRPGKSEPLLQGSGSFSWPQFSPDGRWLAYISDETGRSELYVQSFPPGHGKWQVSREGARQARWRRDGKELVYLEGRDRVRFVSVAVRQRGDALDFDAGVELFRSEIGGRSGGGYFAMTPDGQKFAFNLPGPVRQGNPLTLLLDWMPGVGR